MTSDNHLNNTDQDILQEFFNIEVQYFYENFAKYDPDRKINIIIAPESIYDTIMRLDIPRVQKDVIIAQGKDVTDDLNGTVILGKDIVQDGVHIILSRHAFMHDDCLTLYGTINHEFTHANDFIDFADYVGTTDAESVMSDECWFSVQMWSEFHARRNGFLRVLRAATKETLDFPDDYIEKEIELIRSKWDDQRKGNELYELMQLCGRYSILEEFFLERVSGFNEDMLIGTCFGYKKNVCSQIYQFCKTHTSFSEFIADIDAFQNWLCA